MVHEPEIDLTRGRGLDDGRVLLVLLRVVGGEVEEPLPRRLVSLGEPHRRDERLERRVRRGDAYPSFPPRVREREDRIRDLVLGEGIGVVDEDA